jgi:hypothetical protein
VNMVTKAASAFMKRLLTLAKDFFTKELTFPVSLAKDGRI